MADAILGQDFAFSVFAATITFAVELGIAYFCLRYFKIQEKRDFLLAVVLGNMIVILFGGHAPTQTVGFAEYVLSEALAILFETLILYRAARRKIDFEIILMIDILMNVSSAIARSAAILVIGAFFGWLLPTSA